MNVRKQARPGATVVEFAAIAFVFVIVFFAVFEYSRFVYAKQVVEHATREGARFAAVNTGWYGNTPAAGTLAVQNQVLSKLSQVASMLQSQVSPGSPMTVNDVIVVEIDPTTGFLKNGSGTTSTLPASASDATNYPFVNAGFGDGIYVKVTGVFVPITPLVLQGTTGNLTVSATSVMLSEGN
jgi:Flp pilus assembly protein TadG